MTLNTLCTGSPFQTIGGADSETRDTTIKSDVWNFGTEAWCNLEGRYVSLFADLTDAKGSWDVSVCSLGIMGT